MGQWVITVAGISILAVLCDIILPDGQTRKYIKTVIGIIVTLVMLHPIANFVQGPLTINDYQSSDYSNVQVQQSYLDMVDDKQLKSKITTAQSVLKANGLEVQVVEINKRDKVIALQSALQYSSQNKSLIDKVFDSYLDDYVITIKWK